MSLDPVALRGALEAALVVTLGLAFGSFATLLAARLPAEEPQARAWITGRSRCFSCQRTLTPRELVPVASWLAQRGRCRCAAQPIPLRYPLMELATAGLFLLCWSIAGLTVAGALLMGLAVCVVVMVVADFETYILPDETTLAAALLGVAMAAERAPAGAEGAALLHAALGGLALLAFALAVRWGGALAFRREALGWGDVKLYGAVGLWLGLDPADWVGALEAMSTYVALSAVLSLLMAIPYRLVPGRAAPLPPAGAPPADRTDGAGAEPEGPAPIPFGPGLAAALLAMALMQALGLPLALGDLLL